MGTRAGRLASQPKGAVELNEAVPDAGEDGDVDPEPHLPDGLPNVQAPLADQMVVESHADELAKLWHEDREYIAPHWPAEQLRDQQSDQLLPWAIRTAAYFSRRHWSWGRQHCTLGLH